MMDEVECEEMAEVIINLGLTDIMTKLASNRVEGFMTRSLKKLCTIFGEV
jgi:hypothetical protein